MKHRLLSTLVVAAVAANCTISTAVACDKNRKSASSKSASASGSTAVVASSSKGASSAVNLDHCLAPGVKTVSASAKGASAACATKMTAAECAAKMAAGQCTPNAKTTAVAASATAGDGCCATGATTKSAAKSAGKVTAVPTASGNGVDAVLVGGPGCSQHKASAGHSAHADCSNCSDLALCEDDLKGAQAALQMVPLKNGVMYVYTATGSKNVHTVQTAISRHAEKVLASAGAKDAKLCSDCKTLRGAAASGKLNREVVNIDGGCLTLITSSDPAIVNRLYAMAGLSATTPARVKS